METRLHHRDSEWNTLQQPHSLNLWVQTHKPVSLCPTLTHIRHTKARGVHAAANSENY